MLEFKGADIKKIFVLVAFGCLAPGIVRWAFARGAEVADMKLIVTLENPVLLDGGTIVVIPRGVSPLKLDTVHVEASSRLSFIYFDYGSKVRWSLHFDRFPKDVEASNATRFKLLTVGSATYSDAQGEQVALDQYSVFHVSRRLVSEQESQTLGTNFIDQIKRADRDCRSFGTHAKVCAVAAGDDR